MIISSLFDRAQCSLLWTCLRLCCVSESCFWKGNKKIMADWWKRRGGEETGRGGWMLGVSNVPPPPPHPLPHLLKNILLSELPWGEKGGPLSWGEQGVVEEGPWEARSSSYSHLSVSFPSFPFLCFFNWMDWLHVSHLQSWGQDAIPGINMVARQSGGPGAKSWCSKVLFGSSGPSFKYKRNIFFKCILDFTLVSTSDIYFCCLICKLFKWILTLMSGQLDHLDVRRVSTWPTECQSPALTFSSIGLDEMFKGDEDRLVFLSSPLPGCYAMLCTVPGAKLQSCYCLLAFLFHTWICVLNVFEPVMCVSVWTFTSLTVIPPPPPPPSCPPAVPLTTTCFLGEANVFSLSVLPTNPLASLFLLMFFFS